MEDLFKNLAKVCTEYCKYIQKNKESGNRGLYDRLKRYVDRSFSNPNFSVKLVAAEFNISQSYASRFFKDQAGQAISDYVAMLRMKKAKALLKETNKTVADIAMETGYGDLSTFYRKFKSCESMSPSDYRELSKNIGMGMRKKE